MQESRLIDVICLNIDDSAAVENKVNQAGKLVVNVEDNVTFTIIETFTGSEEVAGNTAFRTLIHVWEKQSCKACTGVLTAKGAGCALRCWKQVCR